MDQQAILVNSVELTKDWKLEKGIAVFGGDYRRHIDIFYIYDKAGITLERRGFLFNSKDDTTIMASIIIHFLDAGEGKPHPKNGFAGKCTIDGVEISSHFNSTDVDQFKTPWHGSWNESTDGSTYKMSIGSATVYPPFRLYFHFTKGGKIETLAVENTN